MHKNLVLTLLFFRMYQQRAITYAIIGVLIFLM